MKKMTTEETEKIGDDIDILCELFQGENTQIIIDTTTKIIILKKWGTIGQSDIEKLRKFGFRICSIEPNGNNINIHVSSG